MSATWDEAQNGDITHGRTPNHFMGPLMLDSKSFSFNFYRFTALTEKLFPSSLYRSVMRLMSDDLFIYFRIVLWIPSNYENIPQSRPRKSQSLAPPKHDKVTLSISNAQRHHLIPPPRFAGPSMDDNGGRTCQGRYRAMRVAGSRHRISQLVWIPTRDRFRFYVKELICSWLKTWWQPTCFIFYVSLGLLHKLLCCELINQSFTSDPPSTPVISGYTESSVIPAGSSQKLLCMSSGGNPPATLTWFKNDKKVNKTWLDAPRRS